jgi:hypothetical protein
MPSKPILANAIALAASGGWLTQLTMLPSNRIVRVRNAFRLRRGRPEDFTWTPSTVPADFRVEHQRAPAVIENAVTVAGIQEARGDWQRALALVAMLLRHWRHDGAIQSDIAGTYKGIVAGGGYCADYVRVFLAAASSIGVFSRQWAFSFDGFGGHGHTFVEVYDRDAAKWIFLDVHNNVYAIDPMRDERLSALEVRDALRGSNPMEFRRAGPGRLGFEDFDKLLDYFRRGGNEWYLWWGNDVITRYDRPVTVALSHISRRLAHGLTTFFRTPRLVAIVTADNERQIEQMKRLKRRVVAAIALVGVLVALFAVQLGWGVWS